MKKEQIVIIQEAVKQSETLIAEINKVVACFETGQDQTGLNIIINITFRIEYIMKALSNTEIEVPKSLKYQELSKRLDKIVDVLECGELEKVGNLLVDEILPIIQQIDSIFRRIIAN